MRYYKSKCLESNLWTADTRVNLDLKNLSIAFNNDVCGFNFFRFLSVFYLMEKTNSYEKKTPINFKNFFSWLSNFH